MAAAGWLCGLGMALLAVVPARAADRVVGMTRPAPLRPGIAAIPEIARPRDAAERRINAAVRRLDAAGVAAVCAGGDWERDTRATMHGPGFLSLEVSDTFYCGGAHPDDTTYTIVYDLGTGRPVDWTKLLPSSLTGSVTLQQGVDGTRTVALASAELTRRFQLAQGPADPKLGDPAQCAGLLSFGEPLPMRVWLDAEAGGLDAMPEIPHGTDYCFEPLVLGVQELRQLGAAPALVDALAKVRSVR